jgi:hypothetical protein
MHDAEKEANSHIVLVRLFASWSQNPFATIKLGEENFMPSEPLSPGNMS